jgi:hypothetical protein
MASTARTVCVDAGTYRLNPEGLISPYELSALIWRLSAQSTMA